MISLFDLATDRLERLFADEDQRGYTVIFGSRSVGRTALAAWIVDTFAGEIDPRHVFRALYVNDQYEQLLQTVEAVREARRERTGTDTDDLLLEHGLEKLPPLPNFTYALASSLELLQDQVEQDSLDLLVLDERHEGGMTVFDALIQRTDPTLTVVLTKHPVEGTPWERFGAPLVLSGNEHPETRGRTAHIKGRRI